MPNDGDVAWDMFQLGQSAVTLSGGEAQRIKLAKEIVRSGRQEKLATFSMSTTDYTSTCEEIADVLHRLTDLAIP